MNNSMNKLKLLLISVLFSANSWAIIPENGWWWNPSESGRGFNLEIQDNLLFFASFAYDSNGNPAWYTAGGPMTSERDWTAQLIVTSRGQCFGCAYVDPVRTVVGTVTLRFTSSQTATLTINGFSLNVERFDFWWNNLRPDAMAGEWSAVIGAAGDIFDAERIDYTAKRTDTSGTYLAGYRLGGTGSTYPAIVRYDATLGSWTALLDSSASYYRYFRFNQTGFNRVEGTFWVYPKGGTPSGSGTFYQAYKTASYAFLTTGTGPASTKSSEVLDASAFDERDAALFARISRRAKDKEVGNDILEAARALEARLRDLKRGE